MRQVIGEDGTIGVELTSGPTCLLRMNLYHEMHHYKIQLYQTISEEYAGIIERPIWEDRLKCSEKNEKNRVIGDDLENITEGLFELLKEGMIKVSFKHFQGLLTRARAIDMELSYGTQES